jgi:hypothetical protein
MATVLPNRLADAAPAPQRLPFVWLHGQVGTHFALRLPPVNRGRIWPRDVAGTPETTT